LIFRQDKILKKRVKEKMFKMKIKLFFTAYFLLISLFQGRAQQIDHRFLDSALPVHQRVDILLSQMTLEEKVGQLRQCNLSSEVLGGEFKPGALNRIFGDRGAGTMESPFFYTGDIARLYNEAQKYLVEETRLGIPGLLIAECLHGHLAVGSTIFPQAIGLGSTWNPSLVKQMASAIALEASSVGVRQALAPVLDLAKDQRFGRVEESYGEDPYLVSRMGVAYINGMQAGNTRKEDRVACMAKHFAAYPVPTGGINLGPSLIGERELRTVHLPPFKAAVKEARVSAIMPSYNEIDGIPAHINTFLLKDILREEWDFKGFVFSDYEGISMLNYFQKVASSKKDAALQSFLAGVDLEAPSDECYQHLITLVREGTLDEKLIDRSVQRILSAKFEVGLFENPYVDEKRVASVINKKEHIDLAQEIAEESIVLLKNKDHLLPLDETKEIKLAIIGPNADRVQFGDYSYSKRKEDGVTVLEGISKYLKSDQLAYAEGCDLTSLDKSGFPKAIDLVENSDIALVVVGGTSAILSGIGWGGGTNEVNTCGEGFDRASLGLPGVQLDLIKELKKTGKPIIVVMLNGRGYSIPWLKEHADGIIEAWYPGEKGGDAIANIIFGRVNPSGRLTVSFPVSAGHSPSNYNRKPSGHGFYHMPGSIEEPGRDYVFSSPEALFSFGFGLSYTDFAFSNLKISKTTFSSSDTLRLEVDVENIGAVKGKEVIQVYLNDLISSVTTPIKELKGFRKIELDIGEKKTVKIEIPVNSLSLINADMQELVEAGEFEVMVGNSSEHILLRKKIHVN
jgi:beta-glucosidase